MPRETTRRVALGIALISSATAFLTGCSSSSSGGGPEPTAHAIPNETFPNVTPKANTLIQKTLPLLRGVATNTYQNGSLVVTFTDTATKTDQQNVESTVHQAEAQAAGKTKGKGTHGHVSPTDTSSNNDSAANPRTGVTPAPRQSNPHSAPSSVASPHTPARPTHGLKGTDCSDPAYALLCGKKHK